MDTSTTRQHSRSAHPRFFRKHSPLGVSCILLGFVLFSFLWLGCEDVPTKYTVTFNTNGGTAVTSQSVKKGDLVTKPADPTRKDYVFGGWYSDAGLTQVYDFKAAVNANITIYAKWTVVTYTVNFDGRGGTETPRQTVAKNATAKKPAAPTRTGFIFDNWYSDEGLTQVYDFTSKVTKTITLYAKWTRTYAVTFDSNGGTAIASQTVAQADTVARPIAPIRAGFIFDNWYSDADLTQVYDFAKKVDAAITLYAKWKQAYKVLFAANGGTATAPQTVAQADTVARPANPTRKDYVFENWYSDEALTQVYNFAAKVTKAITLYAKWTPAYKVRFEINGGTAIATQSVAKEDTITRPADPTKTGFTFAGWYSDKALTQVYDFAAKVTKAITLYAKWDKKEGVTTYTVTFNSKGGTAIVPQTVAKDAFATRPVVAPTREKHVFENWYSDSGLTQVYDFTSKVTQDTTLYAKWTRTYVVTFDSKGGTAIASQTVKEADTVSKPAAPTRENHVFENWYSDSGLTQVYDFTSKVTQDTTLYAKWTPIYRVIFNTNGGTAVAPQSVAKDDTVARPAAPTRDGYVFENWYSDEGLTQVYDFTSKVIGNITIYAKWTPTYRVMFNTNGGTAIAPQTVAKDDTVARPTAPTRKDYDFENWYSDAGLTQVYDFSSKVTGAITLYAKWRLKAGLTTYTVTFDSKGGTAVASQTVKKDDRVSKPTDPTKENYVFGGWHLDSLLTQVYDFTSKVTQDTTLYAKWRPFPTSFTIAAAGDVTELGTSATLQFSITNVQPTGADTAVTWRVEGGAANGTIDANGLYTAPDTVPNPNTIAIKATGMRDTTVTQTYSLTVLATIPDANFRAVLKEKVPNAFSGDLLKPDHAEVTGLKELNVLRRSIQNLEGIQYFTGLTTLNCTFNQLTALDVSKNTLLTDFYCASNQLTALDVSKNTLLTGFYCDNNRLTALDLSENKALREIYCNNNQLTTLDLSKNTALNNLFCNNNQLTALDLSKISAFGVNCSNNRLTSLDVSQHTALNSLTCSNNNLTSLDLSQNTNLREFYCNNNNLTSLDLRGMRDTSLEVGTNSLSIGTGANGKNPLTTLKVHDLKKQNAEIKAAKTNRGTNITIAVYTAASRSAAYTQSCANYDPNANSGEGKCLSTD